MYMNQLKFLFFLLFVCSLFLMSCDDEDPCDDFPLACFEEPAIGPCNAAILIFYFDPVEGICKEFVWGGCSGNVPFETLEECVVCECM